MYQKINKMHYKVYVLSLRILHPKVWDVRFKVWDVHFKLWDAHFKLWDRKTTSKQKQKLRALRKNRERAAVW